METRIPLDQFADFNRCTLVGTAGSIRWAAAMEACDQEINRRKTERKADAPEKADWRKIYVVGFQSKPRTILMVGPDPALAMRALAGR